MPKEKTEICTIQVVIAVDSDEQAIDAKKKISAVIADIPDAQMKFSIMNVNPRGLPTNGNT